MEVTVLKLKCISNMHVGNGDVNYNIIDNEVEKDPVTGYPTINGSGVKGALREYFKNKGIDTDIIFGTGEKQGSVRIMSADFLARPARATSGDRAYYLISTKDAVCLFTEKLAALGIKYTPEYEEFNEGAVEGYQLARKIVIDEEEIYILEDNEGFNQISLPVMARNCLSNGKSSSLWYEEVIPHQSIFVLVVLSDSQEDMKAFLDVVVGKVIQLGGDASIGYGLCKVSKMQMGGE